MTFRACSNELTCLLKWATTPAPMSYHAAPMSYHTCSNELPRCSNELPRLIACSNELPRQFQWAIPPDPLSYRACSTELPRLIQWATKPAPMSYQACPSELGTIGILSSDSNIVWQWVWELVILLSKAGLFFADVWRNSCHTNKERRWGGGGGKKGADEKKTKERGQDVGIDKTGKKRDMVPVCSLLHFWKPELCKSN